MRRAKNGWCLFGFWEGMPYGKPTDQYEDFIGLSNKIPKEKVVSHIESLECVPALAFSKDLFTGEQFYAGVYEDGEFHFPVDFFRYYKSHDELGIPYKYEDYLMDILE